MSKKPKSQPAYKPAQQNPIAAAVHPVNPQHNGQQVVFQQQRVSVHQGPLPPPEVLDRYEATNPGFANRLLELAEKEQRHRHAIEAETNKANINLANRALDEQKLGQVLAFTLAMVLIGSAIFLAMSGQPGLAMVLGGTTLVGAIALFLRKKAEQPQKDRSE